MWRQQVKIEEEEKSEDFRSADQIQIDAVYSLSDQLQTSVTAVSSSTISSKSPLPLVLSTGKLEPVSGPKHQETREQIKLRD